MKKSILLVVISCLLTPMVNAEVFKIGDLSVKYDNILEESTDLGDMKLYYLEEELVFSTFDLDSDGKADSWFEYKDGINTVAMKDNFGNNKPDYSVEFDNEGNVTKETRKKQLKDLVMEMIMENKLIAGGSAFAFLLLFIIIFRTKKKSKKKK